MSIFAYNVNMCNQVKGHKEARDKEEKVGNEGEGRFEQKGEEYIRMFIMLHTCLSSCPGRFI